MNNPEQELQKFAEFVLEHTVNNCNVCPIKDNCAREQGCIFLHLSARACRVLDEIEHRNNPQSDLSNFGKDLSNYLTNDSKTDNI